MNIHKKIVLFFLCMSLPLRTQAITIELENSFKGALAGLVSGCCLSSLLKIISVYEKPIPTSVHIIGWGGFLYGYSMSNLDKKCFNLSTINVSAGLAFIATVAYIAHKWQ